MTYEIIIVSYNSPVTSSVIRHSHERLLLAFIVGSTKDLFDQLGVLQGLPRLRRC